MILRRVVKMSKDIKLERGVRGYNIVRKKCPNCDAEFIFKIHKGAVHDVVGEGLYYPEENVVRCKVCMSTFKYEFKALGLKTE
jgi:uncharacterized protein with PIN domain